MKKGLLFALLLLLGALTMSAEALTEAKASQVAKQFFTQNGRRLAPGQHQTAQFTLVASAGRTADVNDYYVFNRDTNGGYVIVAGDDLAVPVLGYSDSGAFDVNNIPANMQWWLEQYQQELEYLRQHPGEARQMAPLTNSVQPLVTTYWNQSAPYNNMCPTYTSSGKTSRAVTGCVATAMAQIMNYHEWPVRGTGSHSYTCNVGGVTRKTLSVDFSQSTYQWDKMLDIYGSNSPSDCNDAVAKLMSDVGISVDMDYGSSSGALSEDVPDALKYYFGYDEGISIMYRDYLGIEVWESMLRAELDAARPIYYSGATSSGGHAFVFDGYDTDGYFHINWGWGGMSNGYFVVSMLNPREQGIGSFAGGYNSRQAAVIGIQPAVSGHTNEDLSGVCSMSPTEDSVLLGNETELALNYAGMQGAKTWESLYWGVVITDMNGNIVGEPQWSADASGISSGVGYRASVSLMPPTDLQPGNYQVKLAFLADETVMKEFIGNAVDMRVEGNTAYFNTSTDADLSLSSIENTDLYANQAFEVNAVIANAGAEYFDNIYVALINTAGSVKMKSAAMKVAIAHNGTFAFKTECTASVTAGDYRLAILDASNHVIGETPVTVKSASQAASLQLIGNVVPQATVMPRNNIQASAQVKNNGGIFVGRLELIIAPADAMTVRELVQSDLITIEPGETKTVNFKTEMVAEVGETFRMAMRDPSRSDAYYLWNSNFVSFQIGEPQAPAVRGDVDGDDVIDIADINAVVALMLGDGINDYKQRADVDNDGEIDIADINNIIAIILSN